MGFHVLEIRAGFGPARRVRLDRFPFHIGRGHENDLVLDDSLVSRRHASVVLHGEALEIVDLESRNGVRVRGERVGRTLRLAAGDVVTIGPYELRFRRSARVSETLAGTGTVDFFPRSPDWDPDGASAETRATVDPDARAPLAGDTPKSAVDWRGLIGRLVAGSMESFHDAVLETIASIVPVDRAHVIQTEDGDVETLPIVATWHSSRAPPSGDLRVSREVLRRVLATGEAVIVHPDEEGFEPTRSLVLSGARSVLALALHTGERVVGFLYLDHLTRDDVFGPDVIEALAPLAGVLALKLENAMLAERQLELTMRQRELSIAKSVQERFLPPSHVELPGYTFESICRPCREVGGDCLAYRVQEDGRVTFAVGDVTGKGLAAALYMVGVVSTLEAVFAEAEPLERVVLRLSRYVREHFRPEHFLTCVVAELDAATGTIRFANAGHCPPCLVAPDGSIQELAGNDPAMNLPRADEFRTFETSLAPGALLAVYTDGLAEKRGSGDEFGRGRLHQLLARGRSSPLPGLVAEILHEVEEHGHSPGLEDDATLVLLRREAP